MTSPPVACTLTVADQGKRKVELERGLAALIEEVRPLADGYSLRVGAGTEVRDAVDEFIAFERECCSFMSFDLRNADEGGLWLEMRGPEGTADFLREWIPDVDAGGADPGAASWLLRAAAAGGAAAVLGLICCATPLLAGLLALLGLGAAMASIAPLVDIGALVLLAVSAVLLGLEWRARRRRLRRACGC